MTPDAPAPGVPVCYRHPERESHIRCQRCDRPICPDCMRDAAVGFQCPSCVEEGRRSTRSGRTAYGGKRSGNAATTTIALIGINVAVWVATLLTGGVSGRLFEIVALRPRGICATTDGTQYYPTAAEAQCGFPGSRWVDGVAEGGYWELLTSAFAHVEVWHIGFNMLALWVIGPQLEVTLGRTRFLALYLVSALAGSTLVYWASSPASVSIGASGAIFGLFGGLLVIARKVRGDLRPILMLLAVNAVFTIAMPRVSWQAHLGGFLGGLAVMAILVYAPRTRRSQVQAAGISGVVVLLVVAVVVRSLVLA